MDLSASTDDPATRPIVACTCFMLSSKLVKVVMQAVPSAITGAVTLAVNAVPVSAIFLPTDCSLAPTFSRLTPN